MKATKNDIERLMQSRDTEYLYLDGEQLREKLEDVKKILDGLNDFFNSDRIKEPKQKS